MLRCIGCIWVHCDKLQKLGCMSQVQFHELRELSWVAWVVLVALIQSDCCNTVALDWANKQKSYLLCGVRTSSAGFFFFYCILRSLWVVNHRLIWRRCTEGINYCVRLVQDMKNVIILNDKRKEYCHKTQSQSNFHTNLPVIEIFIIWANGYFNVSKTHFLRANNSWFGLLNYDWSVGSCTRLQFYRLFLKFFSPGFEMFLEGDFKGIDLRWNRYHGRKKENDHVDQCFCQGTFIV